MSAATIPGPRGHWLVGNLGDIDVDNTMHSLCSLTRTYGSIWKFQLGSEERIVVASQALMDEVCDEGRFSKVIAAVLRQARNCVSDGLGTAYGVEEKAWGIAHRVLAPHFTPLAIESMFGDMHDVAAQLILKWSRYGPEHDICVADDFTRLTLDAIALCTMDFRFNSFYNESMHPFVDALSTFLETNGNRAKRSALLQPLCVYENHQYWESIERLRSTGHAVIHARKSQPSDKKDLLDAMLNGIDPESGDKMTDDSVVNNMITFLFAGHETTSGLLSFTFYYLLHHPAAYAKAQHEIDIVIGSRTPTSLHLARLPYLSAVLRECLRLSPPVPAIVLAAREDTTLGGKYHVKAKAPIVALLAAVHRDPRVYGSDADEFRPERMLDEAFEQRNQQFPNCWKPFGNGMRGCIGRSFAWQQALLVAAMILQNFHLTTSDKTYRLKIKQSLTIKPDGFRMRARLRHRTDLVATQANTNLARLPVRSNPTCTAALGDNEAAKTRIDFYYGSITGTCQQLASRLADHAACNGFAVGAMAALNTATKRCLTKNPMVLILASYNGKPAKNAVQFVDWISSLSSTELAGACFAVFGCGHRDWAETFLKVPTDVDLALGKGGGERLVTLGTSDAADGRVTADFSAWEERFWPAMRERYGIGTAGIARGAAESSLQVKVYAPGMTMLRHNFWQAQVFATTPLPGLEPSAKKHLEIELPPGVTYRAGDCLAILPQNPDFVVERALRRFGLSQDSVVAITPSSSSSSFLPALPIDLPIRAAEILRAHIDLAQPAIERDVRFLLDMACDESSKAQLSRLVNTTSEDGGRVERLSVLDLLEQCPTMDISLSTFLAMHPPMRARQYCISSSPLCNPRHATVTFSVADHGTASKYLSSLVAEDEMLVRVDECAEELRLPDPADGTPLIMIAAGTGLAPFRSFVQERAAQTAAGRTLGAALLFFGCRSPEDDLYANFFRYWEALGAVSVRRAYSCASEQLHGCRYVQDRIYRDRKDFLKLFMAGARLAVCVPAQAVADIKSTLIRIIDENRSAVMQGRNTDQQVKSQGSRVPERRLDGAWHTWTTGHSAM